MIPTASGRITRAVAPAHRGRSIDRLAGNLASRAERLYVVFALFFMTQAAIPGVWSGDPTEGSLTDSIFAPIYLIAACLIAIRLRRVLRFALAHKLTPLLLAAGAVSWYWSSAPDVTLLLSVAILASTAFGWYLVSRFSVGEIVQVVALILGFTAVLSLLSWIINPGSVTLAEEAGAWRGVYQNRNSFARAMVLSAAAFMLLGLDPERRRWFVWGGVALSSAMVLLSQSRTGLVVLVVLYVLIRVSATLRLRSTILVPVLIACGILLATGLVWLLSHADIAAAGLGRDVTLTGRTDIWAVAVSMIARRPWLGYGYGGFWRSETREPAEVWRVIGWETPNAHNGFLDLTLDLGLLGLVIMVAGFVVALYRATGQARAVRTSDGVGPLVLLAFTLLYNLTESSILKHNNIFWVLYVVAAAASCRDPLTGMTRRVIRLGKSPYQEQRPPPQE